MRKILLACAIAASSTASATEWKGDVELGYIVKSGNSSSESLNAKMNMVRDNQPWRQSARLEASNSSDDNGRTAEKYVGVGQLDYKFGERSYAFGRLKYEEDKFNGYNYESSFTGGYGNQVIKSDDMNMALEIGPGYRVIEDLAGNTEEEGILRVGEQFAWKFSKTAAFEQSLESEAGNDNTISEFKAALKSNLVENFAMKLTYTVKYTETVPDDKEHADKETTITLVYNF